ncbi:MAG: ABC transporter ATP-binding protein [Erysipelotrichaceae bacterium]|nr:ABC transporter ATP-binding protein [Erysipelotrichaceae bacterium]MDD3924278.1 ABC transporter ATP-binding protein [Erysipelotrichaceae bacterium]MDD4642602.1 ABC transporter ATP-binding protein [Erysipelotrichaceae bacterium]
MAGSSNRPGVGGLAVERENKRLRATNKKAIKMIASYIFKQKSQLMLALFLMSVVACANMVAPYLAKIAIDDHIMNGDLNGLTMILLLYVVVYIVFWISSYFGSYIAHKVGHRMIAEVRQDLYDHVISLPLSFYTSTQTGEILSRLTGDVNNLSELITHGITNLLSDVLTIIGVSIIMFVMNARLAIVVLLTVPFILIGISYIGRFMRKAYGSIREVSGKMNAKVEENLAGIRVVKAMGQKEQNVDTFAKINMETFKAQIKASGATALIFPFMTFTSAISTALIVLFGGMMIIEGDPNMKIGVIMAFISYTNRFFIPLRDISQVYGVYQNAAASSERIYEYLSTPITIKSKQEAITLSHELTGDIKFEEVSFAYDKDMIINKLDLYLPAKQITAVVGPTGAGKSTLIKLIARLYDISEGSLKLDNIDIRELDIEYLRKNIMLVSQEVFLFDDTIKENIRYGKPNASDEEVITAAKDACMDELLKGLPLGLDTQVGELGNQLSGGQRQLIAFARAILANRSILILDEATSAVDAKTEVFIQQALTNIVKDKTVIIVAHRFTTLKLADKVLLIANGNVAGYDTHQALLKDNKLYQDLFDRQWSNDDN